MDQVLWRVGELNDRAAVEEFVVARARGHKHVLENARLHGKETAVDPKRRIAGDED